MFRCPYRIRKIKYTRREDHLEESEEIFADCYKDTCPLYVNDKCARAQKEINESYVFWDAKEAKNAKIE